MRLTNPCPPQAGAGSERLYRTQSIDFVTGNGIHATPGHLSKNPKKVIQDDEGLNGVTSHPSIDFNKCATPTPCMMVLGDPNELFRTQGALDEEAPAAGTTHWRIDSYFFAGSRAMIMHAVSKRPYGTHMLERLVHWYKSRNVGGKT